MKVLGIGNAIVDVICQIDNDFLKTHQLPSQGTMKLVNEIEFKNFKKFKKLKKQFQVDLLQILSLVSHS